MRLLLFLFTILALAACNPGQPGGDLVSRETGLSGIYTRQVVVTDHPHHVLLAHVIVAERRGRVQRALIISHQWDGVHGITLREAWQGGTRVPFRRLPADIGCTRARCSSAPRGMVALDAAMLDRAAQAGFAARLVTSVGPIDIAVPADLFAEALAAADR